jgi:hypothetical protein
VQKIRGGEENMKKGKIKGRTETAEERKNQSVIMFFCVGSRRQ